MIKVVCDLQKRTVDISGHAGFDEYGKDIVCAAVSGIAQYFARITMKYGGSALKNDGYLQIEYPGELDIIAEEFARVLKEIAEDYPGHLRVEVK